MEPGSHAMTVTEDAPAKVAVLDPPSSMVSRKALGSVGFDHRLVAYKMNGGTGMSCVDIHGFAEMGRHLLGPDWLASDAPELAGEWIDPQTVAAWVHNVLGDIELSGALRAAIADPELTFREQVERIAPIIVSRYRQYERALTCGEEA